MSRFSGLGRGWPVAGGAVLAAGAVAASFLVASAEPEVASARVPAPTQLVCSGEVKAELSPAVTAVPRNISASGSGTLDNCYSQDGSGDEFKSARVEFSGNGRASCEQIPSVDAGRVTVVWYGQPGQSGPELGTTTFVATGGGGGEISGAATSDSTVLSDATGSVSLSPPEESFRCPLGIDTATMKITANIQSGL